MKEKDNPQIIMDFAKAWETLNPELIIENLDETFVYDSQWVLESLDYKGYTEYIRAKFKTIQNTCSAPTVRVVHDGYNGGLMLSLQQGSNAPAYYRIKISNGKVIKGDLCMF